MKGKRIHRVDRGYKAGPEPQEPPVGERGDGIFRSRAARRIVI